VALDLRGRVDRVAERAPPLAYALRVIDRYNDIRGNVNANSITLTAFLALFAVTLLAVAAIGFLDATNLDVAKEITQALGLSGDAAKVVTNAVNTARKSARFASVVGFIGVVTVGTSFTNAIGTAYNACWGVKGRGVVDRARGLVWLAGIGVLFIAGAVLTDWWTGLPSWLAPLLAVVTVGINAVAWAFTSWWLPNRPITFRAMLPAVLVGAVMLEALKVAAGIWVPRLINNASELWGAIGVVFALIAWILVFGRVIVYVAVIEVLEAERLGGKPPSGTILLP
jgi:membrane protein